MTTLEHDEWLFVVVFTFVLPVIATIGLVGNILSIIVLNNRDKFKSVIYIYLRGVALCDLTYMLFIINMCVVITVSDYRQFKDYYMSWNPPGLEKYLWNYLPPLLNAIPAPDNGPPNPPEPPPVSLLPPTGLHLMIRKTSRAASFSLGRDSCKVAPRQ